MCQALDCKLHSPCFEPNRFGGQQQIGFGKAFSRQAAFMTNCLGAYGDIVELRDQYH
jgi:hypothetical protein